MSDLSVTVKNEIALKEKVSYGLGNFSANLLLTTANTYIVFYYTDVIGISAGVVGTLLLIAKLLDACFDLGIGAVLDSKKGTGEKARPWIKYLMIPFGLSIILMYSTPNMIPSMKVVYAFATYIFAMFIFSAISVPYNSLISLSTSNQKERSEFSSYRNMIGSLGGWLLTVITLPMVAFFGSGRHGWFLTATVYGVVSILCYGYCYRNTQERISESNTVFNDATKKSAVLGNLKTVSRNKYWWIVLGLMIITFISAGLGGINVYFCKYILGSENYVGILGTANFLPMIIGSVVLIVLSKHLTKKQIVMLGVLINLIGCMIIALFVDNPLAIIIGTVLKGAGSSAVFGLIYAMFADTVDYGEWKTGLRAEGMTFSAGSFSEKIGSGIGAIILGTLLSASGYIGGSSHQTDLVNHSIVFIFVYLPILIDLVSIVLLHFYNLDTIYDKITAKITK